MEDDTTNSKTGQGPAQSKDVKSSSSSTVVSLHSSAGRRKERSAKLVSLSQVYDFKPDGDDAGSNISSINPADADDRALPWEKPNEGLHIGADEIESETDEEAAFGSLDLESLEDGERSWHHKVGSAGTVQESFFHAFHGLKVGFAGQRNMRIHCILAVLAITGALILQVEPWGLALIIIVCGFVMFAEMVNTAIEHMVDIRADFKYHLSARYAKDTAAAAVLIASIVALLTGAIVLLPKIFQALFG